MPIGSRLRSFLQELRRRRVSRAAILYLVAAYAVVQFVDTIIVSALGYPFWLLDLAIIVGAAGFPIAVVLAWALQFTGGGVRAETGKRLSEFLGGGGRIVLVLFVVLLSVGMGVSGWHFWGVRETTATEAGIGDPQPLDPARVAVLYFDDYTQDGHSAFLADALTEALIHQLGQVRSLDVISRNGVKPYRGQKVDIDQMVTALRAGSIVEGSVAPGPGGDIRVTFQLIRGSDLSHVHSEYVDAPVGEWIALQDSLVGGVARALRKVLGGELQLRRQRQGNQSDEAWALVARAGRLQADYDTLRTESVAAARAVLLREDSLLARAERLDPQWIEPPLRRGGVARAMAVATGSATVPDSAWCRRALEHAERAVALGTDSARALELRGIVRARSAPALSGDLSAMQALAESDLRRAVEIDPDRAAAWSELSVMLTNQARFEEARLAAQHAIEADQFLEREPAALFAAAYSTMQFGPDDAVVKQVVEGRARYPEDASLLQLELMVLGTFPQVEPDVDRAWSLVDTLVVSASAGRQSDFRLFGALQVAKTAARAGLADSAWSIVHRALGEEPAALWGYDEAQIAVELGDLPRALDLLRRYLEEYPSWRDVAARDWIFHPLHSDPAFIRLVRPAE